MNSTASVSTNTASSLAKFFALPNTNKSMTMTQLTPVATGSKGLSFRLSFLKQASIAVMLAVVTISQAHAAPSTWTATSSGLWSAAGNWNNGIPGATGTLTNTDTATFDSTLGSPIITVDAGRNLQNITFATTTTSTLGANNYAFGLGSLFLTAGGTIQTSSTFVGQASFNTLVAPTGNLTLLANGTVGSSLNFNAITPTGTLNTTGTLTLAGSNSGLFNGVYGIISNGTLSGGLSLVKTGSGTWYLAGADTYTGGTTLNGGTLVVNSSTALGTSGTITVASTTTLRTNTALTDPSARITIADGATLVFDTNNQVNTWSSAVGNSGSSNTASLTKTGLNSLTLQTVAQTYKGATTINGGTLVIKEISGSSNLINSSSALVFGGGILNVTGPGAGNTSSQTFNGTTLNAGVSQLLPASSSGTVTVSLGAITRNSGSLLDITSASGYTFNSTQSNDSGGLLKGVIFNSNGFATSISGTGTIGNPTYTTSGTFQNQTASGTWTNSAVNYASNGTVTGSVSTATINSLNLNGSGNQSFTITGTLAINDGLIFGSSGTLTNTSQISGGSLTGGASNGDLIIIDNNTRNGATGSAISQISSTIVDNGAGHTNLVLYTPAINGSLLISGSNTYTGNTYVAGGFNGNTNVGYVTVGGAAGASLGSAGATVFVNGGNGGTSSVLRVGNSDAFGDIKGTIEVDNGALQLNRTDTNTLSGTVTGVSGMGYITLANSGNTTIKFAGNNTFQALNSLSTATGTLNLTGAGSVNTFISTIPFGTSVTAGFALTATTNFNSGTYIFNTFTNAGNQSTGNWNIQGATVQIAGGRYWNSGGGVVSISSGVLQVGATSTFNIGEQQGAFGLSDTINVSGSGLFDIGSNSNNGTVVLGSNGSGQQTSSNTVTLNQSGGTVQVGVNAPIAGLSTTGTSTLQIGNGLSQVQAAYNLSGGTLRVAGGVTGVAAGSSTTGTFSTTAGSNIVTVPSSASGFNIGQQVSGAGLTGTLTVVASSGSGTFTLSGTATSTATGSATFTQSAANLSRYFNWTGGTLTAAAVNVTNLGSNDGFSGHNSTSGILYQGGGTLRPGDNFEGIQYTGLTAITGSYTIDAGTIALNLGGTTAATKFHDLVSSYDNITVTGSTVLGGILQIGTINSYTPSGAFTLLKSGVGTNSLSGSFTNLQVGKAGSGTTSGYLLTGTDGLHASTITYTQGTGTASGSVTLSNYGAATANTYTGASTSAWDAANAGSWSSFDPGSGAAGSTAVFGTDGTGSINVSLGSNRNVQGILFSSLTAANNYTITATGTAAITLDNTGNGANAYITDSSIAGNQNTINAPIVLNSSLTGSVSNAGTVLTLGGTLTGSGTTTFTKQGVGTIALLGANTYGGATTISGGTLSTGATGSLANGGTASSIGNSSNAASNLVLDGGTLQYASTGSASTTDRLFTLTSNGGGIDASGSNTVTFSNTGSVALSGGGTPTFTLSGTNTGANVFAPVLGNGSGTTSLVKSGSGQWVLSGANTYSGGTTVSGGILDVRNSSALGNTSGGVTVASGATLQLDGTSNNIGNTLTLSGTGSSANSGALVNAANSNQVSGIVYLNADSVISASGTSTLTLSNQVTAGASDGVTDHVLTFNSATQSGTINVTGLVEDNAASGGGVVVNGGLVTFSNANTYSENTTVNAGELDLNATGGHATGFGNVTVNGGTVKMLQGGQIFSTSTLSVSGTGTFNLQGNNQTLGGVQLTGGTIAGTTGVLTSTTAYDIQAGTASANLAGTAGLAKTTAGSATLSGTNTYSGATTIAAGTLVVNGSTGSGSAVTVGNNTAVATLAGTGKINGSLTTASSGSNVAHVAPGATAGTAGTLTLGTLSFTIGSGTNFDYDLANATTAGSGINDLIAMGGGTLTFSGTTTFNFNALTSLATSGNYTLISGAGSIVGFNASNFIATGTGSYTVTFSNSGSALLVSFSAPSAPGTAYFNGTSSDLNAAASYDTTVGGATVASLAPDNTSNVFFSANRNSTTSATTTAPLAVNSLNFGAGTGTNSGITISGTSAITITGSAVSGNTAGSGITTTGSGSNTINAPIALAASQTWTVASGGTLTVSGTVSGSGTALTKAGAGSLALAGNNTYSGGTTLNAGTLVAGNSTTASAGSIVSGPFGTGTLTLNSGSTLLDNGTAITLANALTLNGTITFGSTGTGSLDFDGTTLTTPSQVTLAGATTLIVTNTTTIADTINYGGNILTKTGAGTLYLTGNNSASTADTSVSTGTLTVSSGNNLGSGTTVNLATGTTLQFNGASNATLNQNITVTGTSASINNASGNVLTLSGTLTKNGTTLNITGGKNVISGPIVGSLANSDVNYNGNSTTGLTGASTYNGPTTISGTSTLLTGVNNALPSPAPYTPLTLGAVSDVATSVNTLDLLGTSQTVASITATGSGVNQIISSNGSATTPTIGSGASGTTGALTVNVASGTDIFSGQLGDSNTGAPGRNANNFALTKSGTGTLALTRSAGNTYTGGTTIAAGTLLVSNATGSATGSGSFNLNPGATLTGTGSIAVTGNATVSGTVNVGNGGTLDVLTLTATGTTNFSNASLTFNLDTVAQGNSSVLALGSTSSVVFGSTSLTLNLVGTNPILTPTDYTLFSTTSSTNIFSGLTLSGNLITGGLSVTMTGPNAGLYSGTYLMLVSNGFGGDNIVAVVPEPGTWALLLGGLALLVFCQRARSRKI